MEWLKIQNILCKIPVVYTVLFWDNLESISKGEPSQLLVSHDPNFSILDNESVLKENIYRLSGEHFPVGTLCSEQQQQEILSWGNLMLHMHKGI